MSTKFEAFTEILLYGTEAEVRDVLAKRTKMVAESDEFGFTPLHILMTETRPGIAALLIQAGADPMARNEDGNTPLHICQCPETVGVLIDAGVDVDVRNNDDQTPLIVQAAEGDATGSLATIKALLERGADPAAKDASGATASSIARLRCEAEKVELLETFSRK